MSNFENAKKFDENLLKYWGLSGAKACKSCRSRQELSNEFFFAKFGVDTAENEPLKVLLIIQQGDFVFTEPPRPRLPRLICSWRALRAYISESGTHERRDLVELWRRLQPRGFFVVGTDEKGSFELGLVPIWCSSVISGMNFQWGSWCWHRLGIAPNSFA